MKLTRYALLLDRLELDASIGIHDVERAARQRILVSIEIEIDPQAFPARDRIADAPDYDPVRSAIQALVAAQHFDLQETLARAILDIVGRRREIVRAIVTTIKPDVYPDATIGCRIEGVRQ